MYHYSNILRSEPITQKELNKTNTNTNTNTNKVNKPIKLDKSVDLNKTNTKLLFKHT